MRGCRFVAGLLAVTISCNMAAAQSVAPSPSPAPFELPPQNPIPPLGEFPTEGECWNNAPNLNRDKNWAGIDDQPYRSRTCEGRKLGCPADCGMRDGFFGAEPVKGTRSVCALETEKSYGCAFNESTRKWGLYVTGVFKNSNDVKKYDSWYPNQPAPFCQNTFFIKSRAWSNFGWCSKTGKSILLTFSSATGGDFKITRSTYSLDGRNYWSSSAESVPQSIMTCQRTIQDPCISQGATYKCNNSGNTDTLEYEFPGCKAG